MKLSEIIYGVRPVIEAIKAGKDIEKVFIQIGLKSETVTALKELIKQNDIPFQYVPMEKLNKIVYRNHQGIIAYISSVTYHKIEDIVTRTFEEGRQPLIVILDRITDVRNFGAIARTSECSGADAIIIPSRGAAQINADAVKTSAGALNRLPVCRTKNLKETIRYLKDSGLSVISCTEKGERNFYKANYNIPVAIILGSEEDGISEEYLRLSDTKVKIPVKGEIESLNVSVAAGVILYEAVKQRAM